MINVVFFASLKEQLGCAEVALDLDQATSIKEIKALLIEQNSAWQSAFENRSLLMAINHEMVSEEAMATSGDEVAFFPPVTGG